MRRSRITLPGERIFASESVQADRRQVLRDLGVSAKAVRNSRLSVDMPEDAWNVMLREMLRARVRRNPGQV